ncbi:MAG: hypothetical protein HGA36_02790 [Candidatus Moranbacteria bacterium]|nr:hypothetical protein [Candidatus Moranbacteria bacterium]
MRKITLEIFFIAMIFFMLPAFAKAAVIFEDNFNSHSDWQPRPLENDVAPGGGVVACDFDETCTGVKSVPTDWTNFRTTGWWWGPNYEDTIRITNQADHNNNGKSFIVYNEANSGASGDGWGADGLLTKLFDQDYPEIYARVWLKTDPNWKWATNNDMMIKMFRVKHFDRVGSIYTGFPAGTLAPILLWDIKHSNSWGTRWANASRCDPQETDYYCTTSVPGDNLFVAGNMTIEPNEPGMPADGEWHQLDFHLKMNTYNSETSSWSSDGIYQFSYDGVNRENHSNVLWKRTGSNESIGWNAFDLGGNAFNSYNDNWSNTIDYAIDDVVVRSSYRWRAIQPGINNPPYSATTYWENIGLVAGQIEQWYAMDDVIVSTTEIPENYVIGGIDLIAPAAPTNLNVT